MRYYRPTFIADHRVGQELVARPRRLALMNLFLHNIDANIPLGDAIYEPPTSKRFDVVLTNPPFGKKSSVRMVNEEGEESRETLTVVREDFWATTSNKQLAFMQHVKTLLKIGGRAAVTTPMSERKASAHAWIAGSSGATLATFSGGAPHAETRSAHAAAAKTTRVERIDLLVRSDPTAIQKRVDPAARSAADGIVTRSPPAGCRTRAPPSSVPRSRSRSPRPGGSSRKR